MNFTSKLHKLRVVIVTHEYATGPSHALVTYLRGKTAQLVFIAHPFIFAKEKRSHMSIFDSGGVQIKETFFRWHAPFQFINVIKDALLTLWWCIRLGHTDLFIGVDNINACIGILLRKVGLVKKTVFYTIDYIPHRFVNPFLNAVYHALDGFAVKNADTIWNLSSIMEEERAKKGLGHNMLRKKQIVVPVGTDPTIAPLHFSAVKRYHLAHMGHLTEKQGVQSIIQALPIIRKKIPTIHLDIIGGGEYEGELKHLVSAMKLEPHVTFYGFIKDHGKVSDMLSRCALGVAPYRDTAYNFVRYTDPGKVKAYTMVSLPVIITKVPAVWKDIEEYKCGIAVNDSVEEIARAVVLLLSDSRLLQKFRENARFFAERFRWDKIFSRAIGKSW